MANLVKGRTLSGDENSRIFILTVFSGRMPGSAVRLRRQVSWFVVASTGCRFKASRRGLHQTQPKKGEAAASKASHIRGEPHLSQEIQEVQRTSEDACATLLGRVDPMTGNRGTAVESCAVKRNVRDTVDSHARQGSNSECIARRAGDIVPATGGSAPGTAIWCRRRLR